LAGFFIPDPTSFLFLASLLLSLLSASGAEDNKLKDDPFPERPGGVTKAIQERILL
jgi:hypothetical protein